MSKQILILCGSDSDLPIVKSAADFLDEIGVEYDLHIASAHRTPEHTAKLAHDAQEQGFKVIICAAGGAAHLAGCVAAQTVLPVIGIPIKNDTLKGVDALYATVQMPSGIPVATVAINGAKNAAILATQIIAISDENLKLKLEQYKNKLSNDNLAKDQKLHDIGLKSYLEGMKK